MTLTEFSLFRERKLLSEMTFMLYKLGCRPRGPIGLHMSIAFLLKILNITFCKTVTERGKSWVTTPSCFIFKSRLLSFFLPSQLLQTSGNHRSLSKALTTSVLRRARRNLGMEDVLLCLSTFRLARGTKWLSRSQSSKLPHVGC